VRKPVADNQIVGRTVYGDVGFIPMLKDLIFGGHGNVVIFDGIISRLSVEVDAGFSGARNGTIGDFGIGHTW
jgi:hypothetical protein